MHNFTHENQLPIRQKALLIKAARVFVSSLLALMLATCFHDDDANINNAEPILRPNSSPFAPASFASLDVFDSIELQSSTGLESATIDTKTVHLKRSNFEEEVEITLSYDSGMQTLQITPVQPLWKKSVYLLTVTGIQTLNGQSVNQSMTFFTTDLIDFPYPEVRPIVPTRPYTKNQYLQATQTVRTLYIDKAGADRAWGTDDDEVAVYEDKHYQARLFKSAAFLNSVQPDFGLHQYTDFVVGSGADDVWFTEDDVIGSVLINGYDQDNRSDQRRYYTHPGADGVWHTADEVPVRYTRDDRKSDTEFLSIVYVGAGDDGSWFTDDDVPRSYSKNLTDLMKGGSTNILFVGPGVDQQWFTADDLPHEYTVNEVRDDYGVKRTTQYHGPGNDLSWFTTDDDINRVSVQHKDGDLRSMVYVGPGADRVWKTDDDKIRFYTRYSEVNNTGRLTQFVDSNNNGAIDDADVITDYSVEEKNSAGAVLRSASFSSPGADGEWQNEDDKPDYYYTYEYDAQARIAKTANYRSHNAGDNELNFAASDTPESYTVTEYTVSGVSVRKSYYAEGADQHWFSDDDILFGYEKELTLPTSQGSNQFHITYGNYWLAAGADGVLGTTDDIPDGYLQSSYDSAGRLLGDAIGIGAGQNDNWFDVDDKLSSYTRYGAILGGVQINKIKYIGAGNDVAWRTDDDVIEFYSTTFFNEKFAALKHGEFVGPGSDDNWFTLDDTPRFQTLYTYLDSGQEFRRVAYTGPGRDQVWETVDDEIKEYTESIYNSDNKLQQKTSFHAAGSDGRWLTADDVPINYVSYFYHANKSLFRQITYIGAGADGIWQNPDDRIASYFENTLDSQGNLIRQGTYDGPGNDGVWLNEDDVLRSLTVYLYNAAATIVRWTQFSGPGLDGQWYTEDDTVRQYELTLYHPTDGKIHRRTQYKSPGPDSIWFNDDDTPSSYTLYVYDANRVLINTLRRNDPGSDGVWFNDNDVLI